MFKNKVVRWSLFGLALVIGISGLFLTFGRTSAVASDPQRVLEAYLDSLIAEDTNKAFTYVTFTGKNEIDMRQEFELAMKSDQLLSYKIDKFFNDDDTHASASVTLHFLNQGEQRSVNELLKTTGVWKVIREVSSSTEDQLLHHPSQAVIYQVQEDVRKGKVGTARPSTQPLK
ncbi:hypothetical protein [Paenibacillus qinlingensis]|uniref:DUF4878 domain-containing protein n=1 Tax=Paenibacillus qinlingensis TaxID=1837343 RepID=A0ABU1NNV9_9BACL|nr:hypothetical protein [Paenibacillus qinlingensis]MDR6549149.1 hypothetical protein [Paenibacillus qinlingensis]